MNDQERLEEIKKLKIENLTAPNETIERGSANQIVRNHLDWLMQQAEEKQKYKEALEYIRDHYFDESVASIAEEALEDREDE